MNCRSRCRPPVVVVVGVVVMVVLVVVRLRLSLPLPPRHCRLATRLSCSGCSRWASAA